ncbi:MAG: GntR family transcriptional regulator [Bacteroidales bacterium]|nr:GntR family transcriptional regulator [Bacteroidales bacterium]
MNFKEGLTIYAQMAERLSDEILQGKYAADEKIPGVREYSALLEVNVNTAIKAYDLLSSRGIIYNRRGLGYFVSPNAREIILQARREEFMQDVLPDFLRRMHQLGVSIETVEAAYRDYLDTADTE